MVDVLFVHTNSYCSSVPQYAKMSRLIELQYEYYKTSDTTFFFYHAANYHDNNIKSEENIIGKRI